VASSVSSATSPIDFEELLARCMGRFELLEKLLGQIDSLLSPQISELENAVRLEDSTRIKSIAHRLRGAALTISAPGLSRAAERLEFSAQQGDSLDCGECLDEVLRECDLLGATVREKLARNEA
jgi:HPt (histidine-containing phosphotransfer) domain-containing protein